MLYNDGIVAIIPTIPDSQGPTELSFLPRTSSKLFAGGFAETV